jgi:ketosteroid isomerase-like protein
MMNKNLPAELTETEVKRFYDEFLNALESGDINLLEKIYADDYLLIRSNGDAFDRSEILDDLRNHPMRFISFEAKDFLIRLKGSVGIVTADVTSIAIRDGKELKTRARQIAVVSKQRNRMTISHFQSTRLNSSD